MNERFSWWYLLLWQAIRALENYPTAGTRRALTDILEDDHCFYRIRMEAAHCLAKVNKQKLTDLKPYPFLKSQKLAALREKKKTENLSLYNFVKACLVAWKFLLTLKIYTGKSLIEIVRKSSFFSYVYYEPINLCLFYVFTNIGKSFL